MRSLISLPRRPLALSLASALAFSAAASALRSEPLLPRFGDLQVPDRGKRAVWTAGLQPVTNCDDSGPGSLRYIIAASTNGFIDLSTLQCSTITLTSGQISISSPVLIEAAPGYPITIDGNGTDRIFNHTAGDLDLVNLTLTHGFALNKGGCIYSSGSRVHVVNSRITECVVDSNKSTVAGGGIYALNNLDLDHSTVSQSRVHSSAGLASGGGVFVHGTLTMHASTITGNSADSSTPSGGGGAYALGAEIYGSTIDHNSAFFGGGLVLLHSDPNVYMRVAGTTIANNRAYAIGGLDVFGGSLLLFNSTIAFNCAQSQTYMTRPDVYGVGLRGDTASTGIAIDSSIIANNTICAPGRASWPAPGAPAGTIYDLSLRDGTVFGSHSLIATSSVPLPADTIRVDPQLAALADNGGPTRTIALSAASPAVDHGANTPYYNRHYDQRQSGFSGLVGSAADIGAFEVQSTRLVRSVSNCNDSGSGSLRDVLAHSVSGDAIDLRGLSCSMITLSAGALHVPVGNLELIGPGASQLTLDAIHDRAIQHDGFGTLDVSGMTIANGDYVTTSLAKGGCIASASTLKISDAAVTGCRAFGLVVFGGAIYAPRITLGNSTVSNNYAGGSSHAIKGGGVFARDALVADRCTFVDNTVGASYGSGGAIYAGGEVTISHSTISGNHAPGGGGATINSQTASARIVDSTVSGNRAITRGGLDLHAPDSSVIATTITANSTIDPGAQPAAGLYAHGRFTLQSTIVFGNSDDAAANDVGGDALFIGANNLIGAAAVPLPPDTLSGDPLLGPLQDNGGPTLTHALGTGSPAIDCGNNVSALTEDQRGTGFARVIGSAADIGAFEAHASGDVIFRNGFDGC